MDGSSENLRRAKTPKLGKRRKGKKEQLKLQWWILLLSFLTPAQGSSLGSWNASNISAEIHQPGYFI